MGVRYGGGAAVVVAVVGFTLVGGVRVCCRCSCRSGCHGIALPPAQIGLAIHIQSRHYALPRMVKDTPTSEVWFNNQISGAQWMTLTVGQIAGMGLEVRGIAHSPAIPTPPGHPHPASMFKSYLRAMPAGWRCEGSLSVP